MGTQHVTEPSTQKKRRFAKCKNLARLKLTKNKITDLKALKDLTNIQSLDLADNAIADIGPLSGPTKLQYLELSNNKVADLKPLAGLTSSDGALRLGEPDQGPGADLGADAAVVAGLSHNQVKDLSPAEQGEQALAARPEGEPGRGPQPRSARRRTSRS